MVLSIGLTYNRIAEIPPYLSEDFNAEYNSWSRITEIKKAIFCKKMLFIGTEENPSKIIKLNHQLYPV